MQFNFEMILFLAILISGGVVLLNAIFFSNKRHGKIFSITVEYARSFFPILVIVFLIRSFTYEGYRIPSGSLKPTLLVGDFILVNKYAYGLRLPILHTKILSNHEPQHGDIVVFHGVADPSMNLIKRVIGVPGDHIRYINKVLFINDEMMPQQFVKNTRDQSDGDTWNVVEKRENLSGIIHDIFQIPLKPNDDFDVVVPAGKYFMMGDNRDDSADSRYWGFMPEENIIGKATHVVISFDSFKHPVRWQRMGEKII
ncbi:MAG: signal peptidase I [Gammaproteobacteria bacterium]|nr:signal peptidase I [Gammaproteobacteria bacterium]